MEPKPLVFFEAKAGLNGLESCCFTHAHVGWGALVEAVGARNIGSALLPGATGDVALEKVISMKPDAYIVSGSQWASKTNAAVPFGYGVTQQQVDEAFNRMKQRPGFAQVSAVKEGRFYGIYHNFYNHPYNIVGLGIWRSLSIRRSSRIWIRPRPGGSSAALPKCRKARAFGRAGAGGNNGNGRDDRARFYRQAAGV